MTAIMLMMWEYAIVWFSHTVENRAEYKYFSDGYIWFYNLTVYEGLVYCFLFYVMVWAQIFDQISLGIVHGITM